jgi:hypothetical protein
LSYALSTYEVSDVPPRPSDTSGAGIMERWLKEAMDVRGDAKTLAKVANYTYIAPYSFDVGISMSIEMLYNMPDQNTFFAERGIVYKVIFSLSPPGIFYKDPPLTDGVHFTVENDLESPHRMPSFKDGFRTLEPPQLETNMVLILDVWPIKISRDKQKGLSAVVQKHAPPKHKRMFTVLPISKERMQGKGYRYVATGAYQLPLYEGEVADVTDVFAGPSPRAALNTLVTSGKIKLVEGGASLIVRLKNPLTQEITSQRDWKRDVNTTFFYDALGGKADGLTFGEGANHRTLANSKSTLALTGESSAEDVVKKTNGALAAATQINDAV